MVMMYYPRRTVMARRRRVVMVNHFGAMMMAVVTVAMMMPVAPMAASGFGAGSESEQADCEYGNNDFIQRFHDLIPRSDT